MKYDIYEFSFFPPQASLHAWFTQDPSLFTNGLPGRRTRFPLAAPTTADPRDIAEAAWRRLVARYPHFTYKNSVHSTSVTTAVHGLSAMAALREIPCLLRLD